MKTIRLILIGVVIGLGPVQPAFQAAAESQASIPPHTIPVSTFQSKAAFAGKRTSFTVSVRGSAPLAIQWRLEGRDLPGQTNRTLSFDAVQPADEGDYTVAITNVAGAFMSEAARLYVVPAFTNFVFKNFTNAAGLRLPYFIFLPPNYDSRRSYPVVCDVHGIGFDEKTWASAFAVYPEMLIFNSYKQQAIDPAIVVAPTRRAGNGEWTESYIQQISGWLDGLVRDLSIDTNRVYILGSSEGVHAVWDVVGMKPGFFAAAKFQSGWQGNRSAASIKEVPIWAFHAANDPTVAVDSSRALVRALRRAGGNPIYTEFDSGGHVDGILQAMCIPTVNDWFLAQRRGTAAPIGPRLAITIPASDAFYFASTTNLDLFGRAEAGTSVVTSVAWENLAGNSRGSGIGTNTWNATNIPIQADKTNLVIVTATTTSWAPAFGGNTTFNDTLTVICKPRRVTLALQGSAAILNWTGSASPCRVQRATRLASGDWVELFTNAVPPITLPLADGAEFFRVVEK